MTAIAKPRPSSPNRSQTVRFRLNMATDSKDVGAAAGNMISGTINQAMETTGSIATNKSVISRLTNSLKFIQERKWMQTCRFSLFSMIFNCHITSHHISQITMIK